MKSSKHLHSGPVLLLVDFINHFKFEGAARLAPRAVRAARATAKLKADIKQRSGTCIYTNDNFGEWDTDFPALVRNCIAREGPSAQIAKLLKPAPGDLFVLKPRHSAFYGTPLDFLLQELGVSRLTVAGIAIDMCVMATLYDAHMRKFRIRVPSNCVAGFSKAQEMAALSTIKRSMNADLQPHR